MSWFAIATFSGVETRDAYVKGRDFNSQIARAEEEKALGWHISVIAEALSQEEIFLTLTVKDQDGEPLTTLSVEGEMVRPVHEGADRTVTFGALGEGKYGGAVRLPSQGKWRLEALVRDAGGRERRIVHDIVVGS